MGSTITIRAAEVLRTPCKDIAVNQNVFQVKSEVSLAEACKVLVATNIQAIPVYRSSTESYVAWFGYSDIGRFLLSLLHREGIMEVGVASISELVMKATEMQTVEGLLSADFSAKKRFPVLPPDAEFADALRLFATGVHRVALIDASGRLHGVLAQSSAVRFLATKLDLLDVAQKSLTDLRLVRGTAIAVTTAATVLSALFLMAQHHISSLAITEDDGYIVGSISATDIKYILRSGHYELLWSRCSDFMNDVRTVQGIENNGKDRFPVFVAQPTSLLRQCVLRLVATRAHRLWICTNKLPVGVLSLTDILRAFAPLDSVNALSAPSCASRTSALTRTHSPGSMFCAL